MLTWNILGTTLPCMVYLRHSVSRFVLYLPATCLLPQYQCLPPPHGSIHRDCFHHFIFYKNQILAYRALCLLFSRGNPSKSSRTAIQGPMRPVFSDQAHWKHPLRSQLFATANNAAINIPAQTPRTAACTSRGRGPGTGVGAKGGVPVHPNRLCPSFHSGSVPSHGQGCLLKPVPHLPPSVALRKSIPFSGRLS